MAEHPPNIKKVDESIADILPMCRLFSCACFLS